MPLFFYFTAGVWNCGWFVAGLGLVGELILWLWMDLLVCGFAIWSGNGCRRFVIWFGDSCCGWVGCRGLSMKEVSLWFVNGGGGLGWFVVFVWDFTVAPVVLGWFGFPVADLWDGFVAVCVELGKKESWGKTEKN